MGSRNLMQCGVSLLTGAGLGAALMYLFDPESGDERRGQIGDVARDTLSATGAGLHDAYETVSDSVQDLGARLGPRLHHLRGHSDEMAESLRKGARSMRDKARDARGRARHYLHRGRHALSRDHHDDSGFGSGTFAATAIGTALMGAALMYLFDPQQGRRRRALIRDKGVGMYHDAAGAVRQGGKYAEYARDYAKGTLHEVRRRATDQRTDDRTLEARVRSEMGRVVSAPGQIEVNADGGRITLSGVIPAGERERLVSTVRSVPGVQEVSDQLNPGSTPNRM